MQNTRIVESDEWLDGELDDAVVEREIISTGEGTRVLDPDVASVEPLYRATQIIWYLLFILEAFLAIRFLLRLLDASTLAFFTRFIYAVTDPLVAPFVYVFRPAFVSGAVVEWTTLLSMAVYWLIAYAIIEIFAMSRPVSAYEARRGLRRQDSTQTR